MKHKTGKVRINPRFPFFALAAYFLSGDMWLNYLCAVLFASLHELGHIIPMKLAGCKIKEISLDVMGIRIDKKTVSMSYESECITALCGPLVNLTFALFFGALKTRYDIFVLPFNINTGLFLINMLPVRMLDGGRAINCMLLRFLDEQKAAEIASVTEIAVAVMLIAVLVVTLIFDIVNTSFVFFVLSLVGMIVFGILKS